MLAHTIRDVYHLRRVHLVLPDHALGSRIQHTLHLLRLGPSLEAMTKLQEHNREQQAALEGSRGHAGAQASYHHVSPFGVQSALFGAVSRSGEQLSGACAEILTPAAVVQLLECLVYFEMANTATAKDALKMARCVVRDMQPGQLATVIVCFAALVPSLKDTQKQKSKKGTPSAAVESLLRGGTAVPASEAALTKIRDADASYFSSMGKELVDLLMNVLSTASAASVPSFRDIGGVELVQLVAALGEGGLGSKDLWLVVADYSSRMLSTLDGEQITSFVRSFAQQGITFCENLFTEVTNFLQAQPSVYMSDEQLQEVIQSYEQLGQPTEQLLPLLDSTATAAAPLYHSQSPLTGKQNPAEAASSPRKSQGNLSDQITGATTMELLEIAVRESERRGVSSAIPRDAALALRYNRPQSQRMGTQPQRCRMDKSAMSAAVERLAALMKFTPDMRQTSASPASKTQEAAAGESPPRPPQLPPTPELYQHLLILKSLLAFHSQPELYSDCWKTLAGLLDAMVECTLCPDSGVESHGGRRPTSERELSLLLFISRGVTAALPESERQPKFFLSRLVQYFMSHSEMRFVQRPAAQLELYTTAMLALEPYGGHAVFQRHLPVLASVAAGASTISRSDQIVFISRVSRLAHGATPEERKRLVDAVASVFASLLASGGQRRWSKGVPPAESRALLRAMIALKHVNENVISGIVQGMREETHRFESRELVEHLHDLGRLGVKNLELYTAVAAHVLGLDASSGGGVTLAVRHGGAGRQPMAQRQRLTTKDLCLLLYSFTFVLKGLVKVVQTIMARLKLCAAAADPQDISLALYSLVKLRVSRHLDISRPLCDRAAALLSDPDQRNAFTAAEITSVWSSLRVLRYRHDELLEATMALLEAPPGTSHHRWRPKELRGTIASMVILTGGPRPEFVTGQATAATSMQRFSGSTVSQMLREICFAPPRPGRPAPLDGLQLYLAVTSLRYLVHHGCTHRLTLSEYAVLAVQCEHLETPFSSGRAGPSHSIEAAVEVLLGLQELRHGIPVPEPNSRLAPKADPWCREIMGWRRAVSESEADDGPTAARNGSLRRPHGGLAPFPPKLWRFVCDNWAKMSSSAVGLRDELRASGVLNEFSAGKSRPAVAEVNSPVTAEPLDEALDELENLVESAAAATEPIPLVRPKKKRQTPKASPKPRPAATQKTAKSSASTTKKTAYSEETLSGLGSPSCFSDFVCSRCGIICLLLPLLRDASKFNNTFLLFFYIFDALKFIFGTDVGERFWWAVYSHPVSMSDEPSELGSHNPFKPPKESTSPRSMTSSNPSRLANPLAPQGGQELQSTSGLGAALYQAVLPIDEERDKPQKAVSGSFSGSFNSGLQQPGTGDAEKENLVFNPLQAVPSGGKEGEKPVKGNGEDSNMEDSDFLDVASSSDSVPLGKKAADPNPLAPKSGAGGFGGTMGTDSVEPMTRNETLQSDVGIPNRATSEDLDGKALAMEPLEKNELEKQQEEEEANKVKVPRDPAFSAEEVVNDRRISKVFEKVHNVFFKWKIFFIIVLATCAIVSIVGLVISIVDVARDIRLRVIREVALYSAMCIINSIATCALAMQKNPGQPVAEPEMVSKLRKAVSRSNWRKGEMDAYLSNAKDLLQRQDCEGAADLYNHLFLIASERANELVPTAGPTQMSTFSRGWALGWTQLRSEGILKFNENPPITSMRAITGVSYNIMCLNTIKSASLAPEMAENYECSAAYNNVLAAAPVLTANYALRMDTMLDLVDDLNLDAGTPNPLKNDIFHIVAYGIILIMALIFIVYLIRAPFQNIRAAAEEEIVKRDFHVSSHVEMRRSTLRLLDYYTWRLAVFESVNGKDARKIGFELTDEELEREAAELRELENQNQNTEAETSSRGTHPDEPLLPSQGGPEGPGSVARSVSRDSFAEQLAKNENDDLHSYRGKTLMEQATERARLIAKYAEASMSLRNTAQIQLLIHKVAFTLLLLRPFIPRHTLKPCDLNLEEIQNLGPSLGLRHTQLILQEGLETDISTYLFISFYPFNRPEAVASAKAFHQAKDDLERQKFIEDEAQRQANRCSLFREKNLEKLYEAQKRDDELLTSTHDKESKARESQRLIIADENEGNSSDNRSANAISDVHRSVMNDRNSTIEVRVQDNAFGGRLTDSEAIAKYVEQRKALEAATEKGAPLPSVPNALAPPPELDMATRHPSLRNLHNQGNGETNSHSGNPLFGADRVSGAGALSAKFVSQYPLSNLAAGVNYVIESIFRCAAAYHGDVVQVCGDGVLVKFSNDKKDHDNKLGAKHTREEDQNTAPIQADTPSFSSDDNEDPEDGLTEITLCGQVHHLSAAERAVRTAIGLQESMRNYLDYSADMYVSPELLQCPMAIVSEEFSFKGRLPYHVTKHYAVLSRCIPLIFALERINIEYGAEIVMTEPVKSQVESFVLSRPIHYLQVEDLNYHYIKATKTNARNEIRDTNTQSVSPNGSDDDDDPMSPASPEQRGTGAPSSDSSPSSPRGRHNRNPEERSRFSAKGTIYELFNVLPLNTGDVHFKTYMDDESHNRVRREHWRLIWEKYITIVSVEPQINLLRKFVNTADSTTGNTAAAGTSTSNSAVEHGNGGRGEEANFEGSQNNYHHATSMENSFGNNSTSRMDNRGQSIASSINSMRDRLHDFMRELHTYNHIYEFSSREQYSCEKLWKYGHDLLISLGVTEEDLDNDPYGSGAVIRRSAQPAYDLSATWMDVEEKNTRNDTPTRYRLRVYFIAEFTRNQLLTIATERASAYSPHTNVLLAPIHPRSFLYVLLYGRIHELILYWTPSSKNSRRCPVLFVKETIPSWDDYAGSPFLDTHTQKKQQQIFEVFSLCIPDTFPTRSRTCDGSPLFFYRTSSFIYLFFPPVFTFFCSTYDNDYYEVQCSSQNYLCRYLLLPASLSQVREIHQCSFLCGSFLLGSPLSNACSVCRICSYCRLIILCYIFIASSALVDYVVVFLLSTTCKSVHLSSLSLGRGAADVHRHYSLPAGLSQVREMCNAASCPSGIGSSQKFDNSVVLPDFICEYCRKGAIASTSAAHTVSHLCVGLCKDVGFLLFSFRPYPCFGVHLILLNSISLPGEYRVLMERSFLLFSRQRFTPAPTRLKGWKKLEPHAPGWSDGPPDRSCCCPFPLYTPWAAAQLPATSPALPVQTYFVSRGAGQRQHDPRELLKHAYTPRPPGSAVSPRAARRRPPQRATHKGGTVKREVSELQRWGGPGLSPVSRRLHRKHQLAWQADGGPAVPCADQDRAYHCNVCFGRSPVPLPDGPRVAQAPHHASTMDKAATAVSSVVDVLFSSPSATSPIMGRPKGGTSGAGEAAAAPTGAQLPLSSTQERLSVFLQRLSPILRLVGLRGGSTKQAAQQHAAGGSTPAAHHPKRNRLRAALSFGKEVHAQISRSNLTSASPLFLLSTAVKFSMRPSKQQPAVPTRVEVNPVRQRMMRRLRHRQENGGPSLSITDRYDLYALASDAVRYAVAVYGVAYEQGLLNSLRQGVLLFTHPSYQKLNYASDEMQRAAVERMLLSSDGSPTAQVVGQHYHLDDVTQFSSYVVCVDPTRRRVILTFRGTATLSDAVGCVRDGYATVELLCGLPSTVEGPAPAPIETKIPLGFYHLVLSKADEILATLRAAAAQHPDFELVITGHSLGAIQAHLFHLLLCLPGATRVLHSGTPAKDATTGRSTLPHLYHSEDGDVAEGRLPFRSVRTLCFAPAPTVEVPAAKALAEWMALDAQRAGWRRHDVVAFCHGDDIVPRLQSWSVWAFLVQQDRERKESHAAAAAGADADADGGSGSLFATLSPLQHLRRAAAAALSGPPPPGAAHLCIPGEVFFLNHIGRCGGIDPAPLDDPARVDIPLVTRKHVVSALDVLRHHLPGSYLRRVQAEYRFYAAQMSRRQRCGAVEVSRRRSAAGLTSEGQSSS
eukprot:gene2038-1228_t